MPLARILTRFPEQASALSEELRHRGYTVEFSSPELAGKAPADLEIDFEICAEPDALSRAAEVAEQLHADVAVSPGVVQHRDHGTAEPEAKRTPEVDPANPRDVPPAEEMIGAEEAVREEQDAFVPANVEPNIAEPVLARDIVFEPIAEVPEFVREQAEVTPFDDELEIARAAAQEKAALEHREEVDETAVQSSSATEKTREFVADAGERSRAALQRAGVAAGELWASARDAAQDFWEVARQRAREYHELTGIARAEKRAERQEKLLDLEKRRALAEERAAELEAARQAAAARLQELLRDRGALTEAQPVPPRATATNSPAKAGVFSGVFAKKIRLPFAGKMRLRFASDPQPQMEAILMGVAAACLLFVVGLAVASFHARPAISTTVSQPSSNGVTVQSGGVTVQGGAPAGATASRPVATPRTQSAEKPTPAVRQRTSAKDVTVRNVPAKPSPRRASGSDGIADDVTIRHFGGQANPPAQTAPRAQLRHYSDLDN